MGACGAPGIERYEIEVQLSDLEVEPLQGVPVDNSSPGLRFIKVVADVMETLVLSLALFLGINFMTARIRVEGASMEPTLLHGQFVMVNRLAYRLGEPGYGDVVVFHFPRDPQQEYIKRIVGLPGDKIRVDNGQVFVNDQVWIEPYLNEAPQYNGEWEVPEDQLFVLGDNRNNSSDSHRWGMVPLEYVVGKALFVYWPFTDWKWIQSVALVSQ